MSAEESFWGTFRRVRFAVSLSFCSMASVFPLPQWLTVPYVYAFRTHIPPLYACFACVIALDSSPFPLCLLPCISTYLPSCHQLPVWTHWTAGVGKSRCPDLSEKRTLSVAEYHGAQVQTATFKVSRKGVAAVPTQLPFFNASSCGGRRRWTICSSTT